MNAMNLRLVLAFFCMVACGALAPPQFCFSHGVQDHAHETGEAWVTFHSTILHVATFAMGYVVCKWLKGYPACPITIGNDKACTGTQFSVAVGTDEDVDSTATELSFSDASENADDASEVCTVRGFGATARNLAQIFRQELSEDDTNDCNLFPPSGERCSPSLKHELSESTTDGSRNISDSDASQRGKSLARSDASVSWPPSPPSPSRETSPEQGKIAEVSIATSLSDVDVDTLLLLRGMEHALASRVRATVSNVAVPPWRRSCFYNPEACDMSIFHCLCRVHRAFQCSNPCFIIGLVYMDRVSAVSRYLAISEFTWNKLFITSVVLALKFHDDDYRPYSNTFYANVSGLEMEDLNDSERQLCRLLDWNFYVQPDEYNDYYDIVFNAAACA